MQRLADHAADASAALDEAGDGEVLDGDVTLRIHIGIGTPRIARRGIRFADPSEQTDILIVHGRAALAVDIADDVSLAVEASAEDRVPRTAADILLAGGTDRIVVRTAPGAGFFVVNAAHVDIVVQIELNADEFVLFRRNSTADGRDIARRIGFVITEQRQILRADPGDGFPLGRSLDVIGILHVILIVPGEIQSACPGSGIPVEDFIAALPGQHRIAVIQRRVCISVEDQFFVFAIDLSDEIVRFHIFLAEHSDAAVVDVFADGAVQRVAIDKLVVSGRAVTGAGNGAVGTARHFAHTGVVAVLDLRSGEVRSDTAVVSSLAAVCDLVIAGIVAIGNIT